MMVNNRRAWIKPLAALPLGVALACGVAMSTVSAQNRVTTAAAPTTAQTTRTTADRSAAAGAQPVKAAVAEAPVDQKAQAIEDLAAELKEIQDVQTGLILTLAACKDEPHCVSGIHDQEIASMRERLRKATARLAQEPSEIQPALRQTLGRLQEGADQLQASVAKVESEIDRSALVGNWSDQFVFDNFNAAPAVPYPNEKVPLVRFEDAEQPLPVE
jgi:uncharacterized protein YlxW (UPF0749 family)